MDKHIFIKKGALSKTLCKSYIDYFESSKYKFDELRGYHSFPATFLPKYISTKYPDKNGIDVEQLRDFSDFKKILTSNIEEYVEKHSFLKKFIWKWSIDFDFNIQKYDPGQSYAPEHMEWGNDIDNIQRVLAWMVYLNDINNEGGTVWPQQNFTSIPREGDLYIWPASWTHSHHGIPAPEETKYILTGWCGFIEPIGDKLSEIINETKYEKTAVCGEHFNRD
tara:strand:+ start:1129 stop:1794 length:666 start_codon:yes stop_codon:yes gene_type:complete